MESKHTPGPWDCYADTPSVEPNWHIITNASRQRIIANVHIEPGNAMDLANARMMTAAPELFAMLADTELRLTQARLAAGIGKKKNQTAFLLGEIERTGALITALLTRVREQA